MFITNIYFEAYIENNKSYLNAFEIFLFHEREKQNLTF